MGEPSKLILLEAVLDTIAKENLLARVTEVGDEMISGLEDLAAKYPGVFSNVRGKLYHLSIISQNQKSSDVSESAILFIRQSLE